jgi:hydroxymethylbilane synthase
MAGPATTRQLVIGSRTSRLALWQSRHIAERLQAAWPGLSCRIEPFVTQGDRTLDRPLPEIGGKGLFTAELEEGLRQGQIDIAVHSLKDLPVENAPGLTLGAIVGRADVRDALISRHGLGLADLPPGARVGSSSLRRQAQLLAWRPDLVVLPIRGNVESRAHKVAAGDYDATILAAAGLERLGLGDQVSEWLPLERFLPAPGQGALAVQCRAADQTTLALLAAIEDGPVRQATEAERAFLSLLGGGCSAPIAAYATAAADGLALRGLVASPDGRRMIRVEAHGPDPQAVAAAPVAESPRQGAATMLFALN